MATTMFMRKDIRYTYTDFLSKSVDYAEKYEYIEESCEIFISVESVESSTKCLWTSRLIRNLPILVYKGNL
jgi:hypothetical protein